jgi:sulfonate transport system substrate-binding protein
LRWCGTAGKPSGKGENKLQPVTSEETDLLESNGLVSWFSGLNISMGLESLLVKKGEMKNMKKKWMSVVLLMLVIFLIAGFGTSAQAAGVNVQEIRIATQPGPAFAPIFLAEKQGWIEAEFKKVGVTIKWSSFNSGPLVAESFAAGQQDIGFLGDAVAVIQRSTGLDTRIIGMAASGPQGLAIVVPNNSPITATKDLKGKKISVVKGSYAHHLLVRVLKGQGLTVHDIQLVDLSQADTHQALIKGDVDAGAIFEPLITKLEEEGVARVLVDETGFTNGLLVIVANPDFSAKNPKLVKILLKVYQRCSEFINKNPEEAARLIAQSVQVSPESVVKVLRKYNYHATMGPEDMKELKTNEQFMRAFGIIKKAVDINAFVDTSYLKAASIQK